MGMGRSSSASDIAKEFFKGISEECMHLKIWKQIPTHIDIYVDISIEIFYLY